MHYLLTTIGAVGKVAIIETSDSPDASRGERLISADCLIKNIKNGTFVDVTKKVANAVGAVYVLKADLSR
jgi:hypothetical protein